MASTAAPSRISHLATLIVAPKSLRIADAVCSSNSCRRPQMISSPPSSAKRRPIAAPSPEPPPVMRMRFPLSRPFSNIVSSLPDADRHLPPCILADCSPAANPARSWPALSYQKIRCVHESHPLLAILPTRRSRAGGCARSGGGARRGRHRDQGGGAELLRHPDDPGQVSDQATLPVLAGRGSVWCDRERRRRGHRPQGRRSR